MTAPTPDRPRAADPGSRYAAAPVVVLRLVDAPGVEREVRYLRRRFLPAPGGGPTLAAHTVVQGDRIDLIASRYLGDATRFWQVCDAARVIHPDDLTGEDRMGATVRIPFPPYGPLR